LNVLIVGAGIGGLTTALCLTKAGHEVTVLEQASEFEEVGAGLQCGANAVRVLDYLGLMPALSKLAVEPTGVEFRDYRSGNSLYKIALGESYLDKYHAPYLHLHRFDLHSVLATKLQAMASNSVMFGAKFGSYSEYSDGVTVTLADGRKIEGDCLVAADGIRSAVRSQLLGEQRPRFTGNVAWRGVVQSDKLPSNFMDRIVSNFVGPAKHAVIYYLRDQQLVNFVGVVENSKWIDDSWTVAAPWQELKDDFGGWHETVQTLIDAMDRDQCYRWALYDHKALACWSSKRVTLLGDAAHATLPFMASGAAMAIEDARVLQRALDQEQELGAALELYQRNRLTRTTKIQNNSRQVGALYHINNSLLRRAAFAGLNLVGGSKEDFLPEYNANTVKLL